jgi:hypothetical protein
MKHIDQHTLELFILGSPDPGMSSRQIQRHLKECHGCRELYDEISQYYHRVSENLRRSEGKPLPDGQALVRQTVREEVIPVPVTSLPVRSPIRMLTRTFIFVRQHPVAAGVGSVILASAIFGAVTLTTSLMKDTNPSYYSLNSAEAKLQIYNKENEKLWEVPTRWAAEAATVEKEQEVEVVKITDLDGDGKNEVVATLRGLPGEPTNTFSLCIFSANAQLISRATVDHPVQFRGKTSADTHLGYGLDIIDPGRGAKKEILCRAFTAWSPCAVVRYSSDGELLGEYWHYGHLTHMLAVDSLQQGNHLILIAGTDDVNDTAGGTRFAVVGLLDPKDIVGLSEATTTPGFGYVPSNAERALTQFPNTQLNLTFHSKASVHSVNLNACDSARFASVWWNTTIGSEHLMLEYLLRRDLSVVDIRPSDDFLYGFPTLQKEAKLPPSAPLKIASDLKAQVRYWDGQIWGLQPTTLLKKPLP